MVLPTNQHGVAVSLRRPRQNSSWNFVGFSIVSDPGFITLELNQREQKVRIRGLT